MKLFYSATSPYTRKVLAAIIELGLRERVTLVPADPWSVPAELAAANPLSQVPTLIGDDGQAHYDSPVIAAYLDQLTGGGTLIPAEPAARQLALRLQAIGDGICDCVVRRRRDTMLPEPRQNAQEQARLRDAVRRCLDRLEEEAAALQATVTIGTLAIASALGYIDLRWPEIDWRAGHPRLAGWYDVTSQRPALRETAPPA